MGVTALGTAGEEFTLGRAAALTAGGTEGALGVVASSTGDGKTAARAGGEAVTICGKATAPDIGGGLPAGAIPDMAPDSQTHRS